MQLLSIAGTCNQTEQYFLLAQYGPVQLYILRFQCAPAAGKIGRQSLLPVDIRQRQKPPLLWWWGGYQIAPDKPEAVALIFQPAGLQPALLAQATAAIEITASPGRGRQQHDDKEKYFHDVAIGLQGKN